MLNEWATDFFTADQSQRFFGLEVGTRMSVMRLNGGNLLLHSPIHLDANLRRELSALGHVRYVIAPNLFHHLYVGEYREAYPDAVCFCAPGLEKKRSDVRWQATLGDEPDAGWAGQIDQLLFRGFPLANEVVFLHRASRTLIASDIVFHIGPEAATATRFLFRLLGGYGRFGSTRMERLLIRDRDAARSSLQTMLSWDFDRVVMAHGRVLESGGRESLRDGYAWLLETG